MIWMLPPLRGGIHSFMAKAALQLIFRVRFPPRFVMVFVCFATKTHTKTDIPSHL